MPRTTIKSEDIADTTVVAADLRDDSITNAKIKSDAAIAQSKLAEVTAGDLASTLDLSSKTVTLPAASVTPHAPVVATITSIAYPGSATALSTAGGDNLVVTGTSFLAGLVATIDGSVCPTVTIDSSTQVTLETPAKSDATYTNGLVMVATNGLSASATVDYSGIPTWTTASGEILSFTKLTATTVTVAATGDAPITYAVTSGALPGGLSLNTSTGVISGTGTNDVSAATTYNFTITATDAQSQISARAFSIEVDIKSNYYGDGSDGALNT